MSEKEKSSPLELIPSEVALRVASAATQGVSEGIKGSVSDVWGGLVGDRVRQWRQRNLVKTLEGTASFLKERGVSLEAAHALPDGALYAIFEGASKCDENEIQKLWSSLLAKQMVGGKRESRLAAFAETISGMTTADVKLLNLILQVSQQLKDFNEAELEVQKSISENIEFLDHPQRAEFYEKARQGAQDRQSKFLSKLNRAVEIAGHGAVEQSDSSKANLVRLGLLEPVYQAHKRRGLSGLGNTSASTDARIMAAQMSRAFEMIEQTFHDFEDWASARLAANDRPWADLSSARNIAVYWKLSQYGMEFAAAVGAISDDA